MTWEVFSVCTFLSSGWELWVRPASLLQLLHFVLNHVHILDVLGAYQMDGCLLVPKTTRFLIEMMSSTVPSDWH